MPSAGAPLPGPGANTVSARPRQEAVMLTEKPVRRMTLRQLVTHTEKCSRDLMNFVRSTLIATLTDYRELTRPVRRRSQYPALITLRNALLKMDETLDQTPRQMQHLEQSFRA